MIISENQSKFLHGTYFIKLFSSHIPVNLLSKIKIAFQQTAFFFNQFVKMEKNKILIYGANGYVGQLLLQTIQDDSFEIVLGARQNFDTKYPIRLFSLDNHNTIVENIEDVKLVINLAGPFKYTNKSLVEACIKNGTHYIDIAGEAPELEAVFQFDASAKNANIMLMPGAGFGVVPTDIVANLAKQKLPDATHLKIAYITNGGASRGTLKTVLADINKEGVILEDGVYKKAMPGFKTFQLSAENKQQKLVYNPWRADLFSAKKSTSIQNIETYSNFPNFIVKMMHGRLLWLRDFMLKRLINLLPIGPSAKEISKGSTICFAEVTNLNKEKASVTIYGPEAYIFTVHTLIAITKKIVNDDYKSGYQTPYLYGVELLKNIPSIRVK
ncbi:MAG: saccharopine dehydrogenase family protein [Bacteroidia bacterium]